MAKNNSKPLAPQPKKADRRHFDTWDTFTRMAQAGMSLPLLFTPHLVSLGNELSRIVTGQSHLSPDPNDLRFNDPLWHKNPIYKASMQTYLAWYQQLQHLIEALDLPDEDRMLAEVALKQLGEPLSPSHPALNLNAVKQSIRARGASLAHGLHRMTSDLLSSPGAPKTAPKIGKDVAASAGAVIYRDEQLELIQYQSKGDRVRSRPLLFIPSPINRGYVYDLYPHNSLVHYLVESNLQVFALHWRDPEMEHSNWNLEHYLGALQQAFKALKSLYPKQAIQLVGYAAGGLFAALLASLVSTKTPKALASITLIGTNLFTTTSTQVGTSVNAQMLHAAKTLLRLQGVIDGQLLAQLFAWLRPNSLLWNPWVCNYLAGEDPPTADVKAWNEDVPHISSALFCDFLDLYADDLLTEPGKLRLCDQAVDLSAVQCDAYLVAGANDQIAPWERCYQSSLNLGGKREFVLVNRGHTRLLICPEGSKAARFYTNPLQNKDYDDWLSEATQHQGSWWPHWRGWLISHAGSLRKAPAALGNKRLTPLQPAPGKYVIPAARL